MHRAHLFVLFLFCLVAPSFGYSVCGNTGEDYYFLNSLSTNVGGAPFFVSSLQTGICTPVSTPTCPSNSSCTLNFAKRSQKTYEVNCQIQNLTAVSQVVQNIRNFSTYFYTETDCTCVLPQTPNGKYLSGYKVTVSGHYSNSLLDGTVEFNTNPCSVEGVYQNTPLAVGNIFYQTFILNSAGMIGINFVLIFAMLAFMLIL